MRLDTKVCCTAKHDTHVAVWDFDTGETVCMVPLGDAYDIPGAQAKARRIIEALKTAETST